VFDQLEDCINSYAFDFWSHGQSKKLTRDNGIEDNKVFSHLYELTLGIRTVSIALLKAIEEELVPLNFKLESLLVMRDGNVQADSNLDEVLRSKLNILRVLTGISDRFQRHMKKEYRKLF